MQKGVNKHAGLCTLYTVGSLGAAVRFILRCPKPGHEHTGAVVCVRNRSGVRNEAHWTKKGYIGLQSGEYLKDLIFALPFPEHDAF